MAKSGIKEVKKQVKTEFWDNLLGILAEKGYTVEDGAELGMKGTTAVIRGAASGQYKCDLKITITAPAKGVEY